jgi:hypothetical protein
MRSYSVVIVFLIANQVFAAGSITVTSTQPNESTDGKTLQLQNQGENVGEILCEKGDYKPNLSLEGKKNYLIHNDGDTNPEFNFNTNAECLALLAKLKTATSEKPVVVNLEAKAIGNGQMSRSVGQSR